MKLWARLVVTAVVVGLISILAGALSFVVLRRVDSNEYGRLRPLTTEQRAWLRAEEIDDARAKGFRTAEVLLPVSVLIVWWRDRQRRRRVRVS
jgi:hypothetical protein